MFVYFALGFWQTNNSNPNPSVPRALIQFLSVQKDTWILSVATLLSASLTHYCPHHYPIIVRIIITQLPASLSQRDNHIIFHLDNVKMSHLDNVGGPTEAFSQDPVL